jgi:hypothetical protein
LASQPKGAAEEEPDPFSVLGNVKSMI